MLPEEIGGSGIESASAGPGQAKSDCCDLNTVVFLQLPRCELENR